MKFNIFDPAKFWSAYMDLGWDQLQEISRPSSGIVYLKLEHPIYYYELTHILGQFSLSQCLLNFFILF